MTPQVRVGVGVFVLDSQNNFILGERKGSHGAGTYALPGGHLEPGESFEECSAREILEETALEIEHVRFLTATNSVMFHGETPEMKHYVTIFMVGRLKEGAAAEPKLMEPDKCKGWAWVSWKDMKSLGDAQIKARNEEGDAEQLLETRLFEPLISLLTQRPGEHPS